MAQPEEGGKSPDFHISEKWHTLYKSVCKSVGGHPLFDKYTNLYTLSCGIGHLLNIKTPLEKSYSIFTLEQVDENTEWTVLRAIAWQDSQKDIGIFVNSKKIIEICDQFAETGIKKIYDDLFSDHCRDGSLIPYDELEKDMLYLVEKYKTKRSFL